MLPLLLPVLLPLLLPLLPLLLLLLSLTCLGSTTSTSGSTIAISLITFMLNPYLQDPHASRGGDDSSRLSTVCVRICGGLQHGRFLDRFHIETIPEH
jgi:hypothetical protein